MDQHTNVGAESADRREVLSARLIAAANFGFLLVALASAFRILAHPWFPMGEGDIRASLVMAFLIMGMLIIRLDPTFPRPRQSTRTPQERPSK